MSTHILEMIDLEIGRLTAAREVLVGSNNQSPVTAETLLNGVDMGTITRNLHATHRQPRPMKHKGGGMSPEGRAAVAAAQKARWAKKKEEDAKKARRRA